MGDKKIIINRLNKKMAQIEEAKKKEKINAVIIDDDDQSRKLLQIMLRKYPDVNIVGEAADIPKALDIIKKEKPNSLFLDVCLEEETGFDLIKKLKTDPRVILVSAFDDYAFRAFEYNALDYIKKPIEKDRLDKTIARLYEDIYNSNSKHKPKPEAVGEDSETKSDENTLDYEDRLFITSDGVSRFVKVSSILCITAEKDYSYIYVVGGKKFIVLKSMTEWERRLTSKHFVRIHRSTIVNLEFVDKVEKWFYYSYHVFVHGVEEPLTMSRRFAAKLKERFK